MTGSRARAIARLVKSAVSRDNAEPVTADPSPSAPGRHHRLRGPRALTRLVPSLAIAVLILGLFPGAAVAGTAASLSISLTPDTLIANGTSTTQVAGKVLDADEEPVAAGESVVITSSGDVVGATVLTDASGNYTATLTSSITAGDETITATDGAATDSAILHETGAATHIRVETAADGSGTVVPSQSLAAGSPITVYAVSRDASGNFVANVSATWSMASTAGGVATSDLSTTSGTSTVFTGHLVGTGTIHAIDGSFTADSGVITVIASTATQIAINAGNGQSAAVGTAVAIAPSVIVKDTYGNPVSGVSVTFAIGTGGGSLTGGSATTNASGIATLGSWTLGTTAGSNTLTSTSTGLTGSPLTFTATGTAGTATHIRVETAADGSGTVVPSQSLAAGSPITVYAVSRDASGNFVANVSATWSMASTAGGVATSDLSTTSGTSTVFTGHLVGTGTIHAIDGSFTADSGVITVGVGSASVATSTITAAPTSITTAGSSTITVQLRDAAGNNLLVGGDTVALSSTIGTVGAVTDNHDGTYSATFTSGVTGTATISGTLGIVPVAIVSTASVNVGAGSQAITFGTAPTGVVVGGTGKAVNATGGASGNPVTFSSTTPSVCSVIASTGALTLLAVGTCTIAANQAGNANWLAAPQVTQNVTVGHITGGATYHALTPTRLLDGRNGGTGLAGPFSSHAARTFQVTGVGGVPTNATAVTGNLTVTSQIGGGYLYIGPVATNDPTSSTLNFPLGDDRANGVTVALGAGGTLSVTYVGPNSSAYAYAVFDVTGYFTPDTTGATYFPLTPTRLLDTRNGTGLIGAFSSHAASTFQVTGTVVPSNATAVTGNLTVTSQTGAGYLYIGPVATNDPTSSTLNFPLGDNRANGVTVALGAGGTLSVTFVASASAAATAHVIFDVTGYFTPDTTGATYFPLDPTRLLDTRNGGTGLSGPFSSHVARAFQVTGSGGVPANATGVTGNLTVTSQTGAGYLYIGPVATNNPTSSTLNFPLGDDRANGVTVALGAGGILGVTYVGPISSSTTHVIFDVTGFFLP